MRLLRAIKTNQCPQGPIDLLLWLRGWNLVGPGRINGSSCSSLWSQLGKEAEAVPALGDLCPAAGVVTRGQLVGTDLLPSSFPAGP